MKTIGVCGAGAMGSGIALACLRAGYSVNLYDSSDSARLQSQNFLRAAFTRLVEKNVMTSDDVEISLAHLRNCATLKELAECDMVIEAIIEDKSAKAALFEKLSTVLRQDALIASNTSSFSITALAQSVSNPVRFLGMHFFNPAHIMPLVEIIPHVQTADTVLATATDFTRTIKKTPVLARDTPGFIVNRVARSFYLEAMTLARENAATIEQIDALMRSAGFKLGPFELMDLIGLDVNFAVTLSVWEQFFHEARFAPSPMQREYIEAGRLGRKSNAGFYEYSQKTE
ncbi:MAG: 3-hydroxybutyryl-CoA dehydrogenase [Candidatus Kapaibacterium sp.]|nr:MAG: 3-hydroxybutyryl-CoA dehydrogenase [Candidatus Kapabacteria bacterium]